MDGQKNTLLPVMTFGGWPVAVHDEDDQIIRILRSTNIPYTAFLQFYDNSALIQGSKGDVYTVSLTHCSCQDFATRYKPCKHMYRYAVKIGAYSITTDVVATMKVPKDDFLLYSKSIIGGLIELLMLVFAGIAALFVEEKSDQRKALTYSPQASPRSSHTVIKLRPAPIYRCAQIGNDRYPTINDFSLVTYDERYGYTNYLCYKIKGLYPATNRQRTFRTEARTQEEAIANAKSSAGLVEPFTVEIIDHKMPTERQIEYARNVGITYRAGCTAVDVSALLSCREDDYYSPLDPFIASYADAKGLLFSRLASSESIITSLIHSCDSLQSKAELYLICFLDEKNNKDYLFFSLTENFSKMVLADQHLINSLKRNFCIDTIILSENTLIYKAAAGYVYNFYASHCNQNVTAPNNSKTYCFQAMCIEALDLMKYIDSLPEVKSMYMSWNGDMYENQHNDKVMAVVFYEDALKQVDFENLTVDEMLIEADNFYIHSDWAASINEGH